MQNTWREFEELETTLYNRFHKGFGNRILRKHHKGRRVDKAIKTSNFLCRSWIRIGELCVALILSFTTIIFGNGNTTPNNQELVYPLQEVSTLECRDKDWSTLNETCKKQLPIIAGANYQAYIGNSDYTDIYTVLYGGNYHSGWNVNAGSHYGVDIATAKGTPLYAIADGKVYFAGEQSGYGNVVKIEFIYQGIRYFAIYGHMSSINVKTGDSVSRGQKIGAVGNSGVTMGTLGGYHVHFEIAKGDSGRPVYAFYECKDLDKGGIEVINQGLCRAEMFARTLDPISLLEGAKAKLPHSTSTQAKVEQEHSAAASSEVSVTQEDREQIIKIAKLFIGSPYRMGGTGTQPGMSTDCSNFTKTVFANVGITLERSSAEQAAQFSYGGYRYDSLSMAEVGDLIFFKNTYASDQEVTHVGIYAGNGMMIHAGTSKVNIVTIDSYRKEHFKGIGSFKYLHKDYNKEIAKENYSKLAKTPSVVVEKKETTPVKEDTNKEKEHEVAKNTTKVEEKIINLENTKLDATGKQFFNERNIEIKGDITSSLKKGESRVLTLSITKDNGDKFNGVLKQPIMFVANSTNITIEPVVISLVKDGKVEITLKAGSQSGEIFVAVNMGTNKMGSFNLKVE